jgi:hypothetical protein
MKKSIIFLVMIVFLAACKKEENTVTPAEILPVNLLTNSDLESSQFTNWIKSGLGDTTAFNGLWTTEESFSPGHSLKISKDALDDNFYWWYQIYSGDMPVGEDLTLSVEIKTKNVSGKGAEFSIRCDSASVALQRATSQDNIVITGTKDWAKYSIELKNLGAHISKIYIFLIFQPGTSGEIFFDDITLTHKKP